MDTFAPEFSRFWFPLTARDGDRQDGRDARRDDDARQQKALEELAERVTAARSIV
jgi:hypothetical protein